MVNSSIILKKIEYPILMSKSLCGQELIVLFADKNYGTVVKSNDDSYPIGFFANTWDMTYFRVCNFDVVLSNG